MVFVALQFHYNMCRCGFLSIYLAWELLDFLAMEIAIFHQFQEILSIFLCFSSSVSYIRIFQNLSHHPPCILTAFLKKILDFVSLWCIASNFFKNIFQIINLLSNLLFCLTIEFFTIMIFILDSSAWSILIVFSSFIILLILY